MRRLAISDKSDELDRLVRETPLIERLQMSKRMIAKMWSEGRPPKMSIPVRHDDEYWFISQTIEDARSELSRLIMLIDTPHTNDFLKAVPLEAAHQIKRWGTNHDEGKTPLDWFWLVGYLAQKASHAALEGDLEKAKHHTISTAAVMLNWYRRLTGDDQSFQPGIDPPRSETTE